ncbi:MAG TPA: hypothetical protein VM029_11930 [Opitutaceae bacterium]|nr:hypothetical protein [Opitutaceae bacterium]
MCLFLIVVGAKWATVGRFGSAMPDWDQWDAEALKLFVPWFEHDHFVARLFEPHNEHRIVITKLQNLGLALANGQWDSRLECVTNAMLHAALAVACWLVGRRWLSAWWHAPLFVLVALLFGLPLAWQNILGGFHSQQYWLLGLSFAAIVVLPFARAWSAAWWLGCLAAILAMFTMGSGFLAAIVIVGVVAFRWLRRETTLRAAWPALLVMAALIAVGIATRVEVYYHQQLKAKTAHDFLFSILRSLEWPLQGHDWVGVVMWAPWVVLLWLALRRREPADPRAVQVVLAIGGWVLVQIVATAYARGAGGDYPAIRYMDTLALGALANAIALAWLLSAAPTWRPRLPLVALGLGWLVALGGGFAQLLERNVRHELPDTRRYYTKAEQHLLGYLSTNDQAHLAFPDIPYPSAGGLVERLNHACLRALMPAEVRPSLKLESASNRGFRENSATELSLASASRAGLSPATSALAARPTWGSFGERGAGEQGVWRSAPVRSEIGAWLKFETAGQIGEPGVALELRDATTDSLLANVAPSRMPGDTWRAAYVRVPAQPFVIVARDTDPARWLAFSAPVEMGAMSYTAWTIGKYGLLVTRIAAVIAFILAVVAWFTRRGFVAASP